jgi:Flp pilus assembly protein CpaB
MLLPPGSPAGVHVPPGLRAVAVKVDEGSGVDFHLEPGSRVDVIGYFQTQEGNKRETIARTLIEDVEVAAVGARISAVSAEGESKSSANRPARAVTLLVKPDNVPILHLAEQRGKVKLSMRSADDTQPIGQTRTVSDAQLLGEPEPVAQEKPKEEREPAMGWLNSLFARPASATTQPDAPAVAEPARPEPAPQPPGEPPWVVQVYRGNQVETIQFQNRNSRERVQTQDQKKPGSRVTATAKTPPAHAAQPAAVPATASPDKPASTATPESAGGAPSVNTESETNAQDQVPQEPRE